MAGFCYETSNEPKLAFPYYKKAAELAIEKGESDAILPLARAYRFGVGTEKSLEKAAHYLQIAAENGYTDGYYEAAQCYIELGKEENKPKIDALLKRDSVLKPHKRENNDKK
jgi:TPR repeat protein